MVSFFELIERDRHLCADYSLQEDVNQAQRALQYCCQVDQFGAITVGGAVMDCKGNLESCVLMTLRKLELQMLEQLDGGRC